MDNDKQLIIHLGTGTILDRDECVVVDARDIDPEAGDDEILELALSVGSPIMREI
jgi:hypothetical protein